jgi:hypothetical protein
MADEIIKTTIKVEGVDELLAALKDLTSAKTQRKFKQDMGNAVRPVAAMIKQGVPTDGGRVLSGMVHQGRTRWSPVRAVVKFDAKARRSKAQYRPLLQINVTGSPGGLGFDYAELAGASKRAPRPRTKEFSRRTINGETRTYSRVNTGGDIFIQNLTNRFPMRAKAGRFAYRIFLTQKQQLERDALKILETYASKISRNVRAR